MHEKTLIEHAIDEYLDIPNVKFRFILKRDDDQRFQLSSVIKQAVKGLPVKIITVPGKTSGALCSALMALMDKGGDKDEEVIISNYDQKFNIQLNVLIEDFRKNKPDFGLVSFDSIHPKWSYVRLDSEGTVCEASKKLLVATLYVDYTTSKMKMLETATFNILSCFCLRYFMFEVINQLVLMGKKGSENDCQWLCQFLNLILLLNIFQKRVEIQIRW